jgi:hypothetical protein
VSAADLMLATISVAASQILVGLLIDHTAPRVLIAACGATTLLYAIGWRLITLRLARREQAGATAAEELSS